MSDSTEKYFSEIFPRHFDDHLDFFPIIQLGTHVRVENIRKISEEFSPIFKLFARI